MSVSLDHILTLAGRLDDASGFDAPRERFRRFLSDYIRDSQTARQLIDQCQHSPGDQHRRALHDLVVVLGQFLGFQISFGSAAWIPAGLQVDGTWRSRTSTPITIDVRLAPASAAEFDQQLQSAAASAAAITDAPSQHRELYVVSPLSMNRSRLQDALAATRGAVPIGVVTLHTLVTLADLVSAGRMTHDEIVKLMQSDLGADFVVGLLDQGAPIEPQAPDPGPAPRPVSLSTSFWIAPVVPDYATSPEEFLEVVVGQRHAFGITAVEPSTAAPKQDDWICFYIPEKGVVGHARIASFVGQTGNVREPRRLRQILILQDLELTLSTPVEPDAEAQLRLRTARGPSQRAQILMSVSRESFELMTQGRAGVGAAATRTLSA
jgi:hypothetical protein